MRKPVRTVVALLILLLVAGLGIGGTAAFYALSRQPAPWSSACTATGSAATLRLDPTQARNASIIAGVAMRRGLADQAVTIALATALQESGLRNLGYGDRDSLGLFQQRPSQGWGTAQQVQDPYYAAGAFYSAMVKVKGWESADVGDVAQEVQKSGFPDAYDKRVEGARALAAALTGQAPAALSCGVRNLPAADAAGLASFLTATLPKDARVQASGGNVTVDASSAQDAWAASAIAIANSGTYGVTGVGVADRTWRHGWPWGSSWNAEQTTGATATRVVISLG